MDWRSVQCKGRIAEGRLCTPARLHARRGPYGKVNVRAVGGIRERGRVGRGTLDPVGRSNQGYGKVIT